MIASYSGSIVNLIEPNFELGTEPYIQIGWSVLGDLHRGDSVMEWMSLSIKYINL